MRAPIATGQMLVPLFLLCIRLSNNCKISSKPIIHVAAFFFDCFFDLFIWARAHGAQTAIVYVLVFNSHKLESVQPTVYRYAEQSSFKTRNRLPYKPCHLDLWKLSQSKMLSISNLVFVRAIFSFHELCVNVTETGDYLLWSNGN